jgi:hypothetical protein
MNPLMDNRRRSLLLKRAAVRFELVKRLESRALTWVRRFCHYAGERLNLPTNADDLRTVFNSKDEYSEVSSRFDFIDLHRRSPMTHGILPERELFSAFSKVIWIFVDGNIETDCNERDEK